MQKLKSKNIEELHILLNKLEKDIQTASSNKD
jgi:hypothetical protein